MKLNKFIVFLAKTILILLIYKNIQLAKIFNQMKIKLIEFQNTINKNLILNK